PEIRFERRAGDTDKTLGALSSAGLAGDTFFSALRALKKVAGAGGIEPPHAGIKNRCLTAWRRPNRVPGWGPPYKGSRAGPQTEKKPRPQKGLQSGCGGRGASL